MPRLEVLGQTLYHVKTVLYKCGVVPLFLLTLWLWAVSWGEGSVFKGHVSDCTWNKWEAWKDVAAPHRVLLIADPQLVDPHTYPDRPWPLSSLTVVYTDLYLKRAYRKLLEELQPDSVLFLGDLFDGGREWGTSAYKSPDKQYRHYGNDFWLKEYKRFQNMFVKPWNDFKVANLPSNDGRRIITSLPGNHDLGFAGGINPQVKSRFEAHFGPVNRIDVIGNHTFVSLDTVSLSAMDQVDIETGASGAGDGSDSAKRNTHIWKPTQDFLDDATSLRERAIKREVRVLGSQSSFPELRKQTASYNSKFAQKVVSIDDSLDTTLRKATDPMKVATSQFPTIVLTHVPLYRSDTDHCGPNRERGTAIPISAGYQYQNVLTPLISRDIVEKLDPSQIAMIYSGDDHDYCEIEHDEFTGRIKEITVKSMSWAMGIRRPAVQLVSLWNPVDLAKAIISSEYSAPSSEQVNDKIRNMPRNTVQNHMCLLPDQLSLFIRYAQLLGLTLIVLLVRAVLWKPTQSAKTNQADLESDGPLLPLHTLDSDSMSANTKKDMYYPTISNNNSISSTLSTSSISSRKLGNGNGSSFGGYGNIPTASRSRSTSPSKLKSKSKLNIITNPKYEADSDDWGMPTTAADKVAYGHVHRDVSNLSKWRTVRLYMSLWWIFRTRRRKVDELARSVVFVAGPTLVWYFWLLWIDL